MQIRHKPLFSILLIGSMLGLIGCTAKTGCSDDRTQCFGTSHTVFKQSISQPNLKPQFSYIRFTMNGQVAWLAQGATDYWPQANTKVYYSSDRSVFKWAQGRLVSITTPQYNWRERTLNPVSWTAPKPLHFIREVDMVNGVTAVREQRELVSSDIPNHENYVGDKTKLIWVHEYTISKPPAMNVQASFDNWYAFESNNINEPVYGQHCISKKYCLSWQVWKTL